MQPESQNDSRFVVPVSRALVYGLFGLGILSMMFSFCLTLFMLFQVHSHIHPAINVFLLISGALICFAYPFFAVKDARNFRNKVGIEFEDGDLVIHNQMKKIRLPYRSIEKVTYYPALFTINNKYPQRAWVRIKTANNIYTTGVPFYLESQNILRGFHVITAVNRSALPILVIAMLLLNFIGSSLMSLIYLVLAVKGYFSKNGWMSRGLELSLPGYILGILLLSLSLFPFSKIDRQLFTYHQSLRSGQKSEIASLCNSISEKDHKAILNACATFLSEQDAPEFRDYSKALKLSAEALNRASNDTEASQFAEAMACSYIGLGQKDYAVKVASDYNIRKLASISNGEPCPGKN